MLIKKALHIIILSICLSFISLTICAGQESPEEFNPQEDTGFFYTIKKGDTLWDLSQKFYSSEWDWPGLWGINENIKNPHWIYPGNTIRVFLKDRVKTAQQPDPIIVEPTIIPQFSYPGIDMVGFIRPQAVQPLGQIIKEEETNIMIGTNDLIFIEPLGNGSLVPGTLYHVFDTEEVTHEDSDFSGIKHVIKATIEILEHKTAYVTARVVKSIRTVREGDVIMPYTFRDPVLTVDAAPPPIDAVLLCSEDDNLMINDGFIAFISKGGDANIVPGQIYNVYQKNVKAKRLDNVWKKKKDEIELDPISAGQVIVLHVEDTAATVMMLKSRFDIQAGNMVR